MRMMQKEIFAFLYLLGILSVSVSGSAQQPDSVRIYHYLKTIQDNETLLNQFFMYMPKGGDIHNHLTGSVYAETYFKVAAKDSLWVDMNNGKLYRTEEDINKVKGASPVHLTPGMANLHNTRMRLIDLWSIRNYQMAEGALGRDEYFFGTFGLFSAVTGSHLVEFLAELKNRAARENVQYLEIMAASPKITPAILDNLFGQGTYERDNQSLTKAILTNDPFLIDTLARIFKKWESNKGMEQLAKEYVHMIDSLDTHSNLTGDPYAPLCLYQAYASRNAAPLNVFGQLYVAFKACANKNNTRVVGVNIVSAEDSEQSMAYYDGHMQMFQYLKVVVKTPEKVPVNTSLHAGEMVLGLVKPEDLGDHIHKAVCTAEANRIGHGVDIAFERGSISLLKEMKKRNIPVEINLISNEFILGVKEDRHPFPLYWKAGIPLVISTDDPGILRTNLVEQYTLLVLRYQLDYYSIKQLVRNSIIYSFANKEQKKELLRKVESEFTNFESQWKQNLNTMQL